MGIIATVKVVEATTTVGCPVNMLTNPERSIEL